MVFIKVTENLRNILLKEETPPQVTTVGEQMFLDYQQVKQLAYKHQANICTLFTRQDIVLSLELEEMQRPPVPPEHSQLMAELQTKHNRRMYDRLINRDSPNTYFYRQPDGGVKDMEKSISFAMTFIFSFIFAGLTGYSVGRYFFGWDTTDCMKLAIGMIVLTIMVETGLFIIKINRMTDIEEKKKKMKKSARMPRYVDIDKKYK